MWRTRSASSLTCCGRRRASSRCLSAALRQVVAAKDIDEARRLHERLPEHLLCGEVNGLPPEGFDYGNSPVGVLAARPGREVGDPGDVERDAQSWRRWRRRRLLLVGCLLNRTAVARGGGRHSPVSGASTSPSSVRPLTVARHSCSRTRSARRRSLTPRCG